MFEEYCGLDTVIDGRRYAIHTRRVEIGRDVCRRVEALSRGLLPDEGLLLLVCDKNTWAVAGEAVAESFLAAGRAIDKLRVIQPKGAAAVADDENVEHVREAIRTGGYVGVIAVGSGTVNDVAKMATFQCGIPYVVVATAPSMNGYTSAIAAILSDGLKTTQPCHVPLGVFCDTDVMAEAPYRMIASGLGDLLSRPVSVADWRLAARMVGDFYSSFTEPMLEASRVALEGVAARLPRRDREAVGKLCESLCLSGMAMASVGTSSPASGGEHLISHYLDMMAIAEGRVHDLHGAQVGVGTLVTAALWERLRELEPEDIDVDRCVARHPPLDVYRRTLEQRFAEQGLLDVVMEQVERAYPDRPTLRARLSTLKEDWETILAEVSQSLRSSESIYRELMEAEAPRSFADLGVDPAAARRAVLHCKDIRARYTVLDLVSELGFLEEWTDDILGPMSTLPAEEE